MAGPGPRTIAKLAAIADTAVLSALEQESRQPVRRHTRLTDLEGDGEDEAADAMKGVEDVVQRYVMGPIGSDGEEGETEVNPPTPTMEEVPRGLPSAKAQGKRRIRPQTDEESDTSTLSKSDDESGSGKLDKKVIFYRPKPREDRGHKKRTVVTRPSGRYLEPPCLRCVKGRLDCEKDRAGGACVPCKKKKQGCTYGVITTKKKFKSKAEIESEDDDSDRPIRPPPTRAGNRPNIPAPSITVLDSPTPSMPTETQEPPVPSARLPTRAPPVREARLRASQAIRAAAGLQLHSSPTVEPQPVRRKSGSGSRDRKGKSGT